METRSQLRFDSLTVHAGEAPTGVVTGSTVFPIVQAATFVPGEAGLDRYTRCNNNPSQLAVAAKIAALHDADRALVTASGMSAITTTLLAFLSAGDHLLVQPCLYGSTMTFTQETLPRMGVRVTELRSDPATWASQITPQTKVVYVEAISNPTCDVIDLQAVTQLAAEHSLTAIIDNTFASPANYRPLEHGFDVVVESATKYLNGHSDLIAGCVAGAAPLIDKVEHMLVHMGAALDPHACFLLQRGIKTLALRVERQNMNALALAAALEVHPAVSKVLYPGLPSHPQHDLARRLFTPHSGGPVWTPSNAVSLALGMVKSHTRSASAGGLGRRLSTHASRGSVLATQEDGASPTTPCASGGFGGVLAFELAGGVKAAEAFIAALRVATHAPSLGGVETLVVLPARSSHKELPAEQRAALGITDGLVRVAVGVEAPQDLIRDFLNAADVAASKVA